MKGQLCEQPARILPNEYTHAADANGSNPVLPTSNHVNPKALGVACPWLKQIPKEFIDVCCDFRMSA